tara:strand:+ start:60 stop:383 length:324 start_codon:yes stop_codon:yes gene_type:complete
MFYHITPARNLKNIKTQGLIPSYDGSGVLGKGVFLYDEEGLEFSKMHALSQPGAQYSLLQVVLPQGCTVDSKRLGFGSSIYEIYVARCPIPPCNLKYLGQLKDMMDI